jgi:GntR family transcriptional regulator
MNKYQFVAMDIRTKIADGSLLPGDKLPTIPELCHQYDVSKITIKRAMDDLESAGLVIRRRGSGTYVTHAQAIANRVNLQSPDYTYLVHEFEVYHPLPSIAEQLGLHAEDYVFHICRTAFLDNRPHVLEHLYLPLGLLPTLRVRDASGSLESRLEEETGLRYASIHRRATAILPEEPVATRLGIDTTSPILKVCETYYTSDGHAFMQVVAQYVPSFELNAVITRQS